MPRGATGLQKVLIGLREVAQKDGEPDKTEAALKAATQSVMATGGVVTQRYPFICALAAELPDTAVDALRADPRVAAVEPDLPVHLAEAEMDRAWGVPAVGCRPVFEAGNRGAGIRVAILDTGIDYTHPDLKDGYAGGYDFLRSFPNPMDDNGHGTHVAGIVGARADGQGVVGVAPECRLYAAKVLDARGSGSMSTVVAALQWCIKANVQVANCSFSVSSHPGAVVENAFIAAQRAGVLVVAAAGNSGASRDGSSTVSYPAAFPSCISVGAVDSARNLAWFSSRGPRVDVVAPGVDVTSCAPRGAYATCSGTSMAAPHVSGALALALKRGMTPGAARMRLLATTLDCGALGRDNLFGSGLIQVDRLAPAGDAPPALVITAPAGDAMPHDTLYTFSAVASDLEDGDLSARIVWSLNGQVFQGASFKLRLGDGSYSLTATVIDSRGQQAVAGQQLIVRNQAPVVTILTPDRVSQSRFRVPIAFKSVASDAEEGDVTSRVVWTFLGKTIGTGGSMSYNALKHGRWTIEARVTDSTGLVSRTESVEINVTQ